jgi:hypothetical protein
MAGAYDVIKSRSDAMGVPALEWCIWKADTVFHRLPTDLEREAWFQHVSRLASCEPMLNSCRVSRKVLHRCISPS